MIFLFISSTRINFQYTHALNIKGWKKYADRELLIDIKPCSPCRSRIQIARYTKDDIKYCMHAVFC